MNVGDNVTFHLQTDEKLGFFECYHDHNLMCRFKPFYTEPLHVHVECHEMYQSRTSATVINVEPDNVEYSITISTAERSDNGSYEVSGMFSSYSKCFSVYILGMLC